MDSHGRTDGKIPQTSEERLARFKEELTIETERLKADWIIGIDEARILKEINDKVREGEILGVAEHIIKDEKSFNFRTLNQAVENAHRRAIEGTVLVTSPTSQDSFNISKLQAAAEPENKCKRERFYEAFRSIIADKATHIGGVDWASDGDMTKARALRFATNFPDADPTEDRIGTRIIAWHQGKVKGEEANKLDVNDAKNLYKIAYQALKTAEEEVGYSTTEHVEKSTTLIIENLGKSLESGDLSNHQRYYLDKIIRDYPQAAQRITALDYLNEDVKESRLPKAELEALQNIVQTAITQANEAIDAAEAGATAQADFAESADGAEAPFTINDALEGELSFVQLVEAKIEELQDILSEKQIALLKKLKENGCPEKPIIFEIASSCFKSGEINRSEALKVVNIAEAAWDEINAPQCGFDGNSPRDHGDGMR